MPVTPFQKYVFTLLRSSRNPESYIAGGTLLHRADDSLRYSQDIDIFHDSDLAVNNSYNIDCEVLGKHGFKIESLISQPSFKRAIVSKGEDTLKLDWARDSAFRFFPVVEDQEFGFCLHEIDLAVNKCLALAGRTELRDALDVVEIHRKILSLTLCVWAACGKDPGFTPYFLLDQLQRNSTFTPDMFNAESLRIPIDPKDFKRDFIKVIETTRSELEKLPAPDIGCIYLTQKGAIAAKISEVNVTLSAKHFGSVKGAWPVIAID